MTCDPQRLEEVAYGEVDRLTAAQVVAHAKRCGECERELAWLRAERRLLHGRPLRPVPLEVRHAVTARLPAGGAARSTWLAPLAMAAGLVMAVVLSLGPRSATHASARAACERQDASRGEINLVEAGFGACLIATPADDTYATSRM